MAFATCRRCTLILRGERGRFGVPLSALLLVKVELVVCSFSGCIVHFSVEIALLPVDYRMTITAVFDGNFYR